MRQLDRVTLNSGPPLPQLKPPRPAPPPQPKVISDRVDISFDSLDKPLASADARGVLESFGPDASLRDMWNKLRIRDPQLNAQNSTLQVNFHRDPDWSNFRLQSSRETNEGRFTVNTTLMPRQVDQALQQRQSMTFLASDQHEVEVTDLPPTMQTVRKRSGAASAKETFQQTESSLPIAGKGSFDMHDSDSRQRPKQSLSE